MESISTTTYSASTKLSIAVTFPPKKTGPGPVEANRQGSSCTVEPDKSVIKKAKSALTKLGFEVSAEGRMTISVRGTKREFERAFGTRLGKRTMPVTAAGNRLLEFYAPDPAASWEGNEKLSALIDDAYIQWPHIYANQRFDRRTPSPMPPATHLFSLRPTDVSLLLTADKAHRQGFTGRGVRVAMIDSGFAFDHPYFVERGYNVRSVLAPGATEVDSDGNGHGTGESANVLAMAPDVELIGIKLDHGTDPTQGASILEGIQTAMSHSPQIITVSLGYDLRDRMTGQPLTSLPNWLAGLEAEIRSVVASGVTVIFSAGNGHIMFPGMMREVISVGGVFVDSFGGMEASDYASAFRSRIYTSPVRNVPDFCGLVGRSSNNANYIVLPLPPHCEIDRGQAPADGTRENDGYGAFSGTSASAPQIAGASALLLQKNSGLSPADIKSALASACRPVRFGNANPASNPGNPPLRGRAATGSGLIDVTAALNAV